jgi:hypothetical protein
MCLTRDQPRDVRDVRHEHGAHLIGNRARPDEVEVAGVRGGADHDDLRAVLLGGLEHGVVVDHLGLAIHAVSGEVVELRARVHG